MNTIRANKDIGTNLTFNAILTYVKYRFAMITNYYGFIATHKVMLAISLALSSTVLVSVRFRVLRRWALVGAMLLMGSAAVFSTAYIVSYEQGDSAGGDSSCNHQDQYPPRNPGTPVEGQPEHAAGNSAGASHGGTTGNVTEIAQLRIACQANGIMRGELHVQIATAVGGLMISCMTLVAAFVAVFGYLDQANVTSLRQGSLTSGAVNDGEHGTGSRIIDEKHGVAFSWKKLMGLMALIVLDRVSAGRARRSDRTRGRSRGGKV